MLFRSPEYVAVYLVFASDVLVRVGELEQGIFDHYLAELRDRNLAMADAYVQTAHCTVSFLTDTTTLKLVKQWLADGEISENALYNIVIGQTVLPNWRCVEALGFSTFPRRPRRQSSQSRPAGRCCSGGVAV